MDPSQRFDSACQGEPRLLWKRLVHPTRPLFVQGMLYARDIGEGLLVIDPLTGDSRERRTLSYALAEVPMATDGHTLYVGVQMQSGETPLLCAYDPLDQRVLWTAAVLHPTGDSWRGWTISAADGGLVFVATNEHQVLALRAEEGTTVWSFELPRGGLHRPALTVAGGRVYVTGAGKAGFVGVSTKSNGYVVALDCTSGDLMWICVTKGEIAHAAVVAARRVYAGDHEFHPWRLYCIDENEHRPLRTPLWKYQLEGHAHGGAVSSNTAYWGCYRGYLYAIDTQTGELRWRFHAGGSLAARGAPCAVGGSVFVGCVDGFIYGLDAGTGALRWKTFLLDDEALSLADSERTERKRQSEHERAARDGAIERPLAAADHLDGEDGHSAIVMPPSFDIEVWEAGGRLFALTSQGFHHCFHLPGAVPPKDGTP